MLTDFGTTTTCAWVGNPMKGMGFSSVTCTDAAGGGCTCSATVQQSGWPGFVTMDASTSGGYATSGNVVALDDEAKYGYCVSGSKMTWSSQSTSPTTTGTIVFQKAERWIGRLDWRRRLRPAPVARPAPAVQVVQQARVGRPAQVARPAPPPVAAQEREPPVPATSMRPPAPQHRVRRRTVWFGLFRTSYTGPLYQVRSGSSSPNTGTGGTTKDIGITADGYADAATQDTFCTGSTCTVSILYDQSGNGNNLVTGTTGTYDGPSGPECTTDYESSATKGAVTAGGHKVYALYMNVHEGYRTAVGVKGKGVPTGNTDRGYL